MPDAPNLITATIAVVAPHAKWALWLFPLFCIFITWRIGVRWRREALAKGKAAEAEKTPWVSLALVCLLISFLTMGALLFPLAMAERVSLFFTGDATTATITGFTSRQEQVTREDSDSRRYTETVTMHTPVYTFTPAGGAPREMAGDVKSEDEPSVGHRQLIFYDTGRDALVTASFSNVVMLAFGSVVSFFLVLAFYATLRYAFGRDSPGVFRVMGLTLMHVVVPAAMALLAIGLGVYAWERFMTDWRDDDPVFLGWISAFFAVTLVFAFVGYVQMMLRGRRARQAG